MVYLAEYSIRSVLREKVYRSKVADVDKLKTHLIDDVDAAISLVASSSSAFVCVRGAHVAHFEHKF